MPKAKKKTTPEILQVRPGRALMWPDGTYRAGPGEFVRADDPYLQNLGNLQPAPDGSEAPAAPEGYPQRWAQRYRQEVQGEKPKDPREERVKALEQKAADEEIDGPDEAMLPLSDAGEDADD